MVCVVKPASLGKINQALSFFGILIWENYLIHFKQNFSVFFIRKRPLLLSFPKKYFGSLNGKNVIKHDTFDIATDPSFR